MSTEVTVQTGKIQLPAHLAAFAGLTKTNDLSANVGVSYPVLSLKGKVWAVVRGGEREPQLNAEGDPRGSLEVVLIRANPALSKVYYEKGYEEGSAEKPDCYSNDGVTPASDAQSPQHTACGSCPHNAWGSKIGEAGQKLKACTDSRRMAVAPIGALNDPMLLRIPAASLKGLAEYGEAFDKKGIPYQTAVTKIGFDPEASSPKVTFKFLRFIDAAQAAEVIKTLESAVVKQIIGIDQPSVPVTADVNKVETPKAVAAPAPAAAPAEDVEKKKKAKAAAEAKAKAEAEAKAAAEARAKAEAGARAQAAPTPAAAAPKVETADDLEAALAAALNG